jgi:hypothetical protein
MKGTMDKWTQMLGALSILDDYSPASRATASTEQRKRLFHEALEAMRADTMREAAAVSAPVQTHAEAAIEINGITLTEAQSATIRVAITSWQSRLAEGEAQELGKIGPLYQERCEEILALIFGSR